MNNGASDHDGHIVGVIHEMFIVDGSDWAEAQQDFGAHSAFQAGRREMLIARGDDLQERKKLLVRDADALVVLPGGPGTWDELLEMACAKNIGLVDLPIVCVNVDGYYDSLGQLFHRGSQDGLIKLMPHDILRFESTAAAAVQLVEREVATKRRRKTVKNIKTRKRSFLRSHGQGSMIGDAFGYLSGLMSKPLSDESRSSLSDVSVSSLEKEDEESPKHQFFESSPSFIRSSLLIFTAGMVVGLGIAVRMTSRKT